MRPLRELNVTNVSIFVAGSTERLRMGRLWSESVKVLCEGTRLESAAFAALI